MNKLLVIVFSLTCALNLLSVTAGTNTTEQADPDLSVNVDAYMPKPPQHLLLTSSIDQWETHKLEMQIREQGGVPWGCEDFSVTVKRFVNRHAFLTTVIIVVPMVLVGLIILVPLLILRTLVNKRFGKN